MAIDYFQDITKQWKENGNSINLEVGGYNTVTFQVLTPVSPLGVYGTLNDGQPQGQLLPSGNYSADNALDWQAIQAKNIGTGSSATTLASTGIYTVDVNTRFIRLSGGDVYGLYAMYSKYSK